MTQESTPFSENKNGVQRKFEVLRGEGALSPEKKREELNKLLEKYGCSQAEYPTWCVYGSTPDGTVGILAWIRPIRESKYAAHKIARLMRELGGTAKPYMTEYNAELKGEPIYKRKNQPV